MSDECPQLLPAVIVSDDPQMAAIVSCLLAVDGAYVPIMDGPRMQRPDGHHETIRRNNGIARAKGKTVFLAGVSPAGEEAMASVLPRRVLRRVKSPQELQTRIKEGMGQLEPIRWGSNLIGVGLLKALRAGTTIEFHDGPSTNETVPTKSGHVVVCEEGEDLSEVIAANYAFALGAGLKIIPAVPEGRAKEIMDRLYGLYDFGDPNASFQAVRAELRELCGAVDIPDGGSITFITRRLPFGVAFPEFPSTHLFTYPDLGLAIINGFAAEQPGTPGVNVAVLIDPQTTGGKEIGPAARELAERGTFVRVHQGRGAEVTEVSDTVELYPYDLLVFATHCGDTDGYRWTYAFTDSEGINRELVVDIALGVGRSEDSDRLHVTEFMVFHSLDNVDWNGPGKADLYVGTAIQDFMELKKNEDFKPAKKENIDRVFASAALRMNDSNYLPMHHSLADQDTPIVVNNACVSWHELAARFTFAGARAYVGTLVDVNTLVAQEIVPLLVGDHYGKPLAEAVWAAQKGLFGDLERQPYVTTGVYPQFLRSRSQDTPSILRNRLSLAAEQLHGEASVLEGTGGVEADYRTKHMAAYYARELAAFGTRTRALDVGPSGSGAN